MRDIHVSTLNSKLGEIPAFDLMPGLSCSAEARSHCFVEGCYFTRLCKFRANMRKCAMSNLDIVISDLESFKSQMVAWLTLHRATLFFRVHSGGDFVNLEYAKAWAEIASCFPNVQFLAFTKQFDIVRHVNFPDNFTVILSHWPGTKIPDDLKQKYHVAYMDDGRDEIPSTAVPCSGKCSACLGCWNTKSDVVFHKH